MDRLLEEIVADDDRSTVSDAFEIRAEMQKSAAVLRLLDEVRCDDSAGESAMQCYDRAHNRHNR